MVNTFKFERESNRCLGRSRFQTDRILIALRWDSTDSRRIGTAASRIIWLHVSDADFELGFKKLLATVIGGRPGEFLAPHEGDSISLYGQNASNIVAAVA